MISTLVLVVMLSMTVVFQGHSHRLEVLPHGAIVDHIDEIDQVPVQFPVPVDRTSGLSYDPDLVVCGDHLYVVYSDTLNMRAGFPSVRYGEWDGEYWSSLQVIGLSGMLEGSPEFSFGTQPRWHCGDGHLVLSYYVNGWQLFRELTSPEQWGRIWCANGYLPVLATGTPQPRGGD